MNIFKFKIIIFTTLYLFFIITFGNAEKKIPFDNIVVNKEPINYKKIIFEDFEGNTVNLKNYSAKIYVLNFWTTWCAPCKEEMPSLDKLDQINGIKVFPINIEKKSQKKTIFFFKDLGIKNLSIFFDSNLYLVDLFNLRGVPTTLLLNSEGKEFARVIGSIDFLNKEFIEWISSNVELVY